MSIYDRAFDRTKRGKSTGPTSRFLSWINLHIYVICIAVLLEDNQYIPLAILVILSFTPISPLGIIAVAIYFAFTSYWVGFALLALSWVVGILSVRFGVRFNQTRIQRRSALVDPFEHMPEVGTATIVELISLGMAVMFSGVISILALIAYFLATAFLLWRFWFRLQSGWARLHYPLMLRYSALAGEETAKAAILQREYSIDNILLPFLRGVYPEWSELELNDLLHTAQRKLDSFADFEALQHYIPNVTRLSQAQTVELLNKLKAEIDARKDYVGRQLRYVIAEIIRNEYDEQERLAYIGGLLTGRVE